VQLLVSSTPQVGVLICADKVIGKQNSTTMKGSRKHLQNEAQLFIFN
jgi:hypothetical protein